MRGHSRLKKRAFRHTNANLPNTQSPPEGRGGPAGSISAKHVLDRPGLGSDRGRLGADEIIDSVACLLAHSARQV